MTDSVRLRRRLVRDLRRDGSLSDDRVAAAFATVPRHEFVPDQPKKDVYTDRAFITKQVDGVPTSSSSQPSIMALMLEQLDVAPGMRVLEIGAGTGYNAALLSALVGDDGHVTTVDIDVDTAEAAREHLRSAGCKRVEVLAVDGGFGHRDGAPYDRIIATAACWQIPQPWIEQLAEGGLIVLPFRLNGAHVSLALRKHGDELLSVGAEMCGFMPLRGAFGPQHAHILALPDMRVAADTELGARMWRSVARLLQDGRQVRVAFPRGRDRRNSPLYYLILQGKPVLLILRRIDSWGDVPFALAVSAESAISLPWHRPKGGWLTLFGSDEGLEFLRDALARWQVEGRPDLRDLQVRVRPSRARASSGLPRRVDGRYRFRRGGHLYELWFER